MEGVPGTLGLGLMELEIFLLADGMEGAVSQTEKFVSIQKARLAKNKKLSITPRFADYLQEHMLQQHILTWNLNSGACHGDGFVAASTPFVAVLVRFKDASRIDECLFASSNAESIETRQIVVKCSACGVMHRVNILRGSINRHYLCHQCKPYVGHYQRTKKQMDQRKKKN